MTGSFSYASFSRTEDRVGGWGFGEFTGSATPQLAAAVRTLIPSTIAGDSAPGNYPTQEEIAQLTRRFAWLPVADSDPDAGFAFYASAQAGQDSTGRPGNVFTYVQLSPDAAMGLYHPTRLLYSPDIPTPFGKRQVDRAKIPESIIVPGPITDELIDSFLLAIDPPEGIDATETAPLGVHFPGVQPAERILKARAIAAVISRGRRSAVIACPLPEAGLWVAAIARELGYPSDFSFSTLETPESIQTVVASGCKLSIISDSDVDAVAPLLGAAGVVLVDATKPLTPMMRQYLDNPGASPVTAPFPAVEVPAPVVVDPAVDVSPPVEGQPVAEMVVPLVAEAQPVAEAVVPPLSEIVPPVEATPLEPVPLAEVAPEPLPSVPEITTVVPEEPAAAPTSLFSAGSVFDMASNPFEEETPVVPSMPTHHITGRTQPLETQFTEFETRLNAHIAPLSNTEQRFIQSSNVFDVYFAMNQAPTEENLPQVNRYYEWLLLDPADALGRRVRGSFVAMILLHGLPRYWFGEASFVALTFTQKEPVVHEAARCVIEWINRQHPEITAAEYLSKFRQQATRNASLTALQNVVYKRARQYALETLPPAQPENHDPLDRPPEAPLEQPIFPLASHSSPVQSEELIADPEKLQEEQQVVAGKISTAIWQFTDQQRQPRHH